MLCFKYLYLSFGNEKYLYLNIFFKYLTFKNTLEYFFKYIVSINIWVQSAILGGNLLRCQSVKPFVNQDDPDMEYYKR